MIQGDALAIPLSDASVDVVVSFETIEHVHDPRAFVRELKRGAKPSGVALLSTPNELESPDGNHFHLHELEYAEADALLREEFRWVTPYYQGTWFYTAIVDESAMSSEWRRDIDTLQAAPLALEQAMYLIFLASNDGSRCHCLPSVPCPSIGSPRVTQLDRAKADEDVRAHMTEQQRIMDHLAARVATLEFGWWPRLHGLLQRLRARVR